MDCKEAPKNVKMTACSFCAKKEVKNDALTSCFAGKKNCSWSVCGKVECQEKMADNSKVGH